MASTRDLYRGQDLLYACLSQAGSGQDREFTLSTLQSLVKTCDEPGAADSINLPLLLRCTIRVLRAADQDEYGQLKHLDEADLAPDTCRLFESAAKHAVHDLANAIDKRCFTTQELDWFRNNSYNLGILTCRDWQPLQTVRLLNACLTFITCYPTDIAMPQNRTTELALTALRCHFIISASLLKQARVDDDPSGLKHYQAMRRHITEYGTILQTKPLSIDAHTQHDLNTKYATLLVYDFEAAIRLAHYTDITTIITLQRPPGNILAYKAMGDILLQSSTPPEILTSALKLIINEIHTLENFDAAKLAKYLRCLFHVLVPKDDALALKMLDQFTQVTSESKAVGMPLPTIQIEWFVARTFNHALDHYVQFREETCRIWASKAMKLADLVEDGGVLVNTLRTRFGQLRFHNEVGVST